MDVSQPTAERTEFSALPERHARELNLFGVALHTLKHRDVSQIDRVLEWFVCLVAGFAFAIRQSTKIDRMLKGNRLRSC